MTLSTPLDPNTFRVGEKKCNLNLLVHATNEPVLLYNYNINKLTEEFWSIKNFKIHIRREKAHVFQSHVACACVYV